MAGGTLPVGFFVVNQVNGLVTNPNSAKGGMR